MLLHFVTPKRVSTRRLNWALLLFCSAGSFACNEAVVSTDTVFSKVVLDLRVTSGGQPLAFAYVGLSTDPIPVNGPLFDAHAEQTADQASSIVPGLYASLGPDGRALVTLGTYAPGVINTLSVQVNGPGCASERQIHTPIRRPIGGTAHDTIVFEVQSRSFFRHPVATVDTGNMCADGIHAFRRGRFSLLIRIDSIPVPNIYGRWYWAPSRTDTGEWGPLLGTRIQDVLVIDLLPDSPLRRCEGTRLLLRLAPDGSWLETEATSSFECLGGAKFFTFGHTPGGGTTLP